MSWMPWMSWMQTRYKIYTAKYFHPLSPTLGYFIVFLVVSFIDWYNWNTKNVPKLDWNSLEDFFHQAFYSYNWIMLIYLFICILFAKFLYRVYVLQTMAKFKVEHVESDDDVDALRAAALKSLNQNSQKKQDLQKKQFQSTSQAIKSPYYLHQQRRHGIYHKVSSFNQKGSMVNHLLHILLCTWAFREM